jgi:hypothetical protein
LPIEYNPKVVFGLTPDQLGLFFSPTPVGQPALDQAVAYNRDFSFDAIVSFTFGVGDESADAIKRVVYWPLLPPDLVPAMTDCGGVQRPNSNPELANVNFFRHRVDGIPQDDYGKDPITISLSSDQLFVEPAYPPDAEEHYYLRVNNAATGMVETQCRQELLTFQFFTTAGTFEPAQRTSRLSPVLTAPDNNHIPIDSQWKPPKPEDLPADGTVTVWIVSRDERAGVAWLRRQFTVTP